MIIILSNINSKLMFKNYIFNIVSINMNEEEKINTNSDRKKYRNGTHGQANRIIDARSEIRKDFNEKKVTDPREKLRELPLKQAKERRQNAIEENRAKTIEENKKTKEGNSTDIMKMIKEIIPSLKWINKINEQRNWKYQKDHWFKWTRQLKRIWNTQNDE